jgi:integrase
LEWLGDVPVSSIARDDMLGFLAAMQRLPMNANKYAMLKGLSLRQLVEAEGYKPIASATVNQIMDRMSAFFGWLETDRTKWRVSGNVAKGLKLANVDEKRRVAFSEDDLRAMFTSPEWVARKFLHSYAYWLLPLGLFTGARINELCQIELKDFSEVKGYSVISLCTEGLRGKNKNARRTLPVHPELIRLGLLRPVERLRHAGEVKLFPECVEKRDGHGQDASRWFGKFKIRAGITDSRKVFHSTRHAFVSQLLDAGVDESTGVAPLVGHARGGEATRTYWNEKDVRRLIETVQIVSYSVVKELAPPVEDVAFGIDVHRGKRRPPIRVAARSRK